MTGFDERNIYSFEMPVNKAGCVWVQAVEDVTIGAFRLVRAAGVARCWRAATAPPDRADRWCVELPADLAAREEVFEAARAVAKLRLSSQWMLEPQADTDDQMDDWYAAALEELNRSEQASAVVTPS